MALWGGVLWGVVAYCGVVGWWGGVLWGGGVVCCGVVGWGGVAVACCGGAA